MSPIRIIDPPTEPTEPSRANVRIEHPKAPIVIGELVPLRAWFEDAETGEVVQPAEVTIRVRPPQGTAREPKVEPSIGGVFAATVEADQSGTYWYRISSPPGAHQGAVESFFQVKPSRA